jgi:diguanylate cyclase (GGDEF)-like protein/PAS domain S-box-containing protein
MSATADLHAALLRHAGDIVTVVGSDGLVRYVNEAPRQLLGEDGGEAPGSEALGYVHPEDVAVALERRRWLLEEPGRSGKTVLRVHSARGWRHVETTGVNLTHDPAVQGILYITRDVEDRVVEREQLGQALAGQRLVADLGVLALTTSDLDALLPTALRQVGQLLGVASVTLVEHASEEQERPPRTLSVTTGDVEPGDELRVEVPGPSGPLGELTAAGFGRAPSGGDEDVLRGVANVLAGALLRAEREQQAVTDALHDELTGLATRPLLMERLTRALARPGTSSALLLLDLDRFKEVNDAWGHAAGDEVLAELGPRLETCVRPTDTVARYGGDEFVVLIEDVVDPQYVEQMAKRLRYECGRPFVLSGGQTVLLSGSVGVAWTSRELHAAPALIAAADEAMYRAKRSMPALDPHEVEPDSGPGAGAAGPVS